MVISKQRSTSKPFQSASRNTQRLSEYIDNIQFRKSLGKSHSEGAQMYQDMTMSEIVEELEENGRSSRLYFLFKHNDQILKDIETMNQEKQSRFSTILKKGNSDFPTEKEMQYDSGLTFKPSKSD